jgi:hypothetical protein
MQAVTGESPVILRSNRLDLAMIMPSSSQSHLNLPWNLPEHEARLLTSIRFIDFHLHGHGTAASAASVPARRGTDALRSHAADARRHARFMCERASPGALSLSEGRRDGLLTRGRAMLTRTRSRGR